MTSTILDTERFASYPNTIDELKAQSRAEARLEVRLSHVRTLTETLSISADEAMNLLDIPEDERPMVIKRLSL